MPPSTTRNPDSEPESPQDASFVRRALDEIAPEIDGESASSVLRADVREALADAELAAVRIRDLVRDVKSVARQDDSKRARVDLNELVHGALRLASTEVKHRANVHLALAEDVDVVAHPGQLSQVFINLLVNAAQAFVSASSKYDIHVTTRRSGDRVFATVSDNGPGIPETVLPRIFDPYFTTKGREIGTGLGLAISRDIVRSHGGDLEVNSQPGHGTTFIICLPFALNG